MFGCLLWPPFLSICAFSEGKLYNNSNKKWIPSLAVRLLEDKDGRVSYMGQMSWFFLVYVYTFMYVGYRKPKYYVQSRRHM